MKSKTTKKLKRHLKTKVYLFLALFSMQVNAQSITDKRIALGKGSYDVSQVMESISKDTGLLFLYAERPSGKLLLENDEMKIDKVLKQMQAQLGINAQIKGNQIAISKTNKVRELVEGIVRTRQGETLPGASVRVKGSTTGTVTDMDGKFRLNVSPGDVLQVSFIGFQTAEYVVNNATLDIILMENTSSLDEVVVTGQGMSIQKRRLSTNVVSVSGKELEKFPANRFDQLLQAKIPNAQIRLTGGQAGATSIIRARGVVSAFVNSTPVIYVDGVRMDNLNTASTIGGGGAQSAGISSLADIPMDNIERIEYVNGGAATTLFGSDAANGVIQIFTKKSGDGRLSLNFGTEIGLETPTTDFLRFKRVEDLLFQNGLYQRYNLGINGSNSEGFGYSFTMGYLNSDGVQIFDQNKNDRLDMRSGFSAKLGEKVVYESSFSFINNRFKRNRNGNQGGYTGLWYTESGASATTGPQPRFNPDIDNLPEEEYQRMREYVRKAERLQDNEIVVNRFQTSQSFTYKPLESITMKAVGGIDYRTLRNQVITTNEYLTHTTGNLTTNQGSISNGDRKFWGLTLEANAQHRMNIGEFSFVSTFGGQLFRNEDRQVSYVGTNIRDGARNIADAALKTSNEVYYEVVNYGVYFQENLGFKDKMFLELGLRGDGNSAFGQDIGVQYYPKVGFSYIPTFEPFFEDMNWLSSLKLRGNYGVAGNFPTPFMNLRTISFPGYLGEQAAVFGTPGADLRPEKTSTLEVGMDFGLFKDRLAISVGYYNATTNDALFRVPSSPSSGESDAFRNVGEINNKGIEVSMNLIALQKLNQSLSFNLSVNTNKNIVVNSGGSAPFNINGFSERTVQTVVQEGFPVGFIRGSKAIFNDEGLVTEVIPLQNLGTTIPDLYGSMGLNYEFKSFNFFANADYQRGAFANNWDSQFRYFYGAGNEGIPQAEIDQNGRAGWLNMTNMFIEKTDFIKVRVIGANYVIRANQSFFKTMTIGFNVQNPLNFATSSFDPEATISGSAAGQGGATTGGISYATYAAPRQYIGSVKFNF
ncbi:TonB-dependent receptor [Belliella sp. DSM 111904]|uniref:TonB-dependent receptor n=1 Tax=Belliella filtrata TaxID=2923435 RepID=A0ABS9V560_9BACT|nr:TonB-dependent receptor [Belliella filtrata]MCH7411552.1 TonB-dependent receptor [Belliella filtrata]